MDCYKDTEQEVERVASIWNWQLFQRRRSAHEVTRGESLIPVLIPSVIILSSFDTSPTRCLPAGNWTRFQSPSSFILRGGSNPLSVTIQAKFKRNYIFITFFVRILPFYGYFLFQNLNRGFNLIILWLWLHTSDRVHRPFTEPSFKYFGLDQLPDRKIILRQE